MKREAFLQVVSKESIEDFLRYTQNPVSEPVYTYITSGVINNIGWKSCGIWNMNVYKPADFLILDCSTYHF